MSLNKFGLTLLTFCFCITFAFAQADGSLQLNDEIHSFLMRQQTNGLLNDAFLSNQPLSAYEARKYLVELDSQRTHLSKPEQLLLDRFLGKRMPQSGKNFNRLVPFLYKNGNDFIEYKGDDFAIQFNPILNFSNGAARVSEEGEETVSRSITSNTRGVRVAGYIGKHIYFDSAIEDHIEDSIKSVLESGTIPRAGVTIISEGNRDNPRYNYFVTTGSVGFRNKHFDIRFGRNNNRWGAGINSLLLSNYAPVYEHLQIKTTLGRIQYTNLFAGFNDLVGRGNGDEYVPRKFGTFHQLSIKLPYRFELSFFETVIAAPDTTKKRFNGYDIGYLNPIIFYRAVEHDRGSPDNALIGGGLSWVPVKKVFVYGQFLLDEFKLSELTAGNGWWANKWGLLGGVHLTPTPKIEARAEYAVIRPFTYSHNNPHNAYVHNNDILGHQAGPNSKSFLGMATYRMSERLFATASLTYTRHGRDSETENYGGDPRLSNTTRLNDYGNEILQGIKENTFLFESRVGYELLPQFFLEAGLEYQTIEDGESGTSSYFMPFANVRMTVPYRYKRY